MVGMEDIEQAKSFLRSLFRCLDTKRRLVLALKSETSGEFDHHWFSSLDEVDYQKIAAWNETRNIFFGVNCYGLNNRRNKENVVHINALPLDVDHFRDGETIETAIDRINRESPLPFHYLILSGYGIHGYYLVEGFPLNIELYEDYVSRIIHHFSGDAAAKDMSRMMRLPGTYNLKHGTKKLCRIIEVNESLTPYSLSDIKKAFPHPVPVKVKSKTNITSQVLSLDASPELQSEGDTFEKLIQISPLTKKFWEAVKNPKSKTQGHDRSKAETILCRHLFGLGFSKGFVSFIIQNYSSKYLEKKNVDHKDCYLTDKLQQEDDVGDLLKNEVITMDWLPSSTSTGESLSINVNVNALPVEANKWAVHPYFTINDNLKTWYDHYYDKDPQYFYCLNVPPGQGKTNLIKMLTTWEKPHKKILIAVERNNDAIRLKMVLSNLDDVVFYKKVEHIIESVSQKKPPLGNLKDVLEHKAIGRRIIGLSKDYLEEMGTTEEVVSTFLDYNDKEDLKALLKTSPSLRKINKEEDGYRFDSYDNRNIVFTCSPSESICLLNYSNKELYHYTCGECSGNNCSAHPTRKDFSKTAKVNIITHKKYVLNRENEFYLDGIPSHDLFLTDELPDIFPIYSIRVWRKSGGEIRTSLDNVSKVVNLVDPVDKLKRMLNEGIKAYEKSKTDIFKEIKIPSIKGNIESLKKEILEHQKEHSFYESNVIWDEFNSLVALQGQDCVATLRYNHNNKTYFLTVKLGVNRWSLYRFPSSKKCIIFDGTSHVDPHYSLPYAPKILLIDESSNFNFPNLTFNFTADKWDVHKRKADYGKIESLVSKIKEADSKKKILIVTSLDIKEDFKKMSNQIEGVWVEHFGSLKGKNAFIETHAIIFTNLFRREELDYLLMAKAIVENKGYEITLPKEWTPKVGKVTDRKSPPLMCQAGGTVQFNNPVVDAVRCKVDVCDIVQTIFRTQIRRDHAAMVDVYIPAISPGIVKRIIEAFPGCNVRKMNNVNSNSEEM